MGQTISLIGTWIQQVALQWLVYRVTGSAWILGVVGFSAQIPNFLLTPFTGVLTDRWNRHHILVGTQIAAMLQALVLAVLVLTGNIPILAIIFLSLFLGTVNALDIPARQSLWIDMIEDRKDLGNAIALNSSMVNVTRLIGPVVAGLLIVSVGEGMCFLVNAFSYVAVILPLLGMKIPQKKSETRLGIFHGLKEGFYYASGFLPIRAILLLLAFVSLVGMPYTVLLPIFARELFHGGPQTLGFLVSSSGLGALSGALYLASRKGIEGLGKIMALASALLGSALAALSFCQSFEFSLGLLFIAGFGMLVLLAASNTAIQVMVDDDKRGRVMSFYTMAFMGMTPFGSLLAGSLAAHVGVLHTVFASGLCCLAASFVFARQLPALRESFKSRPLKSEVLSELESGIQTASELSLPPED